LEIVPEKPMVPEARLNWAAIEERKMHNYDYTILLVEDEENDGELVKLALKKNKISNPIQWVRDGLEAVAYLNGDGIYADRARYPFPQVLLLDLKMPRMTGLELLAWIKDKPDFKVIPTIVMTSSQHDRDIETAYHLGANTYMIKPSSFEDLAKMIKVVHEYWAVSVKPKTKRPAKT
jgi:CheY-like chemotaxis protein